MAHSERGFAHQEREPSLDSGVRAAETRSVRRRVALTILLLLSSCHLGTGVHQAEVLSKPFPGIVLSAHASHGKCGPEGCPFDYRVQITNPTDGDANVQECVLQTSSLRLPVMGIAGIGIPAQATKTVRARFLLPIQKDAAAELVGRDVTCTGLDWHGNAPI